MLQNRWYVPAAIACSFLVTGLAFAAVDTTPPIINEVKPIPTTQDHTPKFTYSSSEPGHVTFDGGCGSEDESADAGENTILMLEMEAGIYETCTMTVTDAAGNTSEVLHLTPFEMRSLEDVVGGGLESGAIPVALVVTPNGGETYGTGKYTRILYSSIGSTVAGSRVSFSAVPGIWSVIAEGQKGGTFEWLVPVQATTRGRIKVEALDAEGAVLAEDISDNDFTVTYALANEPGTSANEGEDDGSELANSPGTPFVPSEITAAAPSFNVELRLGSGERPGEPACESDALIKLPTDLDPATTADSAIYYCSHDGKRYLIPNLATFHTWYDDFSKVVEVSEDVMAQIPLAGNMTYRPGTRMVKLASDPKVYAVDNGGVLRWVTTEYVAVDLYGAEWATFIDDLPEALFTDYVMGLPIIEQD